MLNFELEGKDICAIVENHAVADVDVLFYDQDEVCNSRHAHKVGVNSVEAKANLKVVVEEMHTLSANWAKTRSPVEVRNAVMRSVFTPDTPEAPKDVSELSTPAMDTPGSPGMESLEMGQLASCQEVTKAAMPSMTSPTSLGGAALVKDLQVIPH